MTIEKQQTTLTDAQAKEKLAALFANGLGISGHRVSNGADYYRCDGCGNTREIMGYSDMNGDIQFDVEHDASCGLVQLYNWCKPADET